MNSTKVHTLGGTQMQFMYVHHALSLKTAGTYVLLYAHITRNTHSYSVHAHKLASQHGAHCSLSYPDLAFLRRLHQQLVSEQHSTYQSSFKQFLCFAGPRKRLAVSSNLLFAFWLFHILTFERKFFQKSTNQETRMLKQLEQ